MKKTTLSLGSAFLSLSLMAGVTVSDVTVRQDWPWSSRIDVSYALTGVTRATSIQVELYDGMTKIGTVIPSGDWLALGADGTYKLSFDLSDVGYEGRRLAIGDFKVKLLPQAAHPSWDFPLYKDIDLTTGTVTDITPAQIVSGTLGTWKWTDGATETVSDSGAVAYTNLIWTGVAANDDYKTSHLVLRYLAAKGDRGDMYHQDDYTMPEDFYMAVFETTQKQWQNVMGEAADCAFPGDAKPVETISYDDVRGADEETFWPRDPASDSFVGKLRDKANGLAVDLPAVYQWNYAAMAHSLYAEWKSPSVLGWNDNSPVDGGTVPGVCAEKATAVVGSYNVSTLGLYDMIGNVSELCVDFYKSGQTQKVQKDLGNRPNVNQEDPAYALNPSDEKLLTRAWMGPKYNTAKTSLTLNTSDGHGCQASNARASGVGFRLICPAVPFDTSTVALTDVTPGESASVFVYAKPQESFLWRTAPGTTFTVSWTLPEGATKATLSVAGHGYSQEYVDLTATSQELTLPAASAGENVYTLTLTPDAGVPKTAQLAVVRGGVDGGTATITYAPEGTKKWQAAANWNVLPLLCGATTLQVGGTSIPCDGAAGWYGLDLSAAEGETAVRLTVGADEYENALVLPNGLLLLFR